ncbi:hypothetical protein SLEP1_g45578 [Rubroshorea leprosula]|uniref:Uncharacterized protein n=1 Tax=Rubroshorea leprosula TaxID=152421 RepID=A0AAV5LM20_9ROSI|nr:hypothetical protein SLEP1_g45578 [Rubroshorea leprosula]
MDLVVRRHCLPNEGLRKEAMKTGKDQPKKKQGCHRRKDWKDWKDLDQKIGEMAHPNKAKGVKRECCEAKQKVVDERASKKQKEDAE